MMSLTTLILVLVSLGLASSQETYSNKYDNVDIDLILRNPNYLTRHLKCVLDEGPCPPEGRYFKNILPDALATNCDKCSPKMKINVRKIANFVKKQRPDDWTRFLQKYDSDNKYTPVFERFLTE